MTVGMTPYPFVRAEPLDGPRTRLVEALPPFHPIHPFDRAQQTRLREGGFA